MYSPVIEFEKYPERYKKLRNKFRAVWYVPPLEENYKHKHPIENLPKVIERIQSGELVCENYIHEPYRMYGVKSFICDIYYYQGRYFGIVKEIEE